MRLLVSGADRVDAGKTTFTTGLVEAVGAVGYKPRGGNDYWFHHGDYRNAIEQGRLYGNDAHRLAGATGNGIQVEAINPIHRLWMPTPDATGVLGLTGRQFLVDRVREPGTGEDRYVVNGTVDLPDSAREELPLADATVVEDLSAFNDLMAHLHAPALAALASRVRETDRAVIESYGDVATPLPDVGVDAVAVVEPTRASIYDGDRYMRACQAVGASARQGRLEETVGAVVDLLDRAATVRLPALTDAERTDPATVADAYDPAYDALLAIALE